MKKMDMMLEELLPSEREKKSYEIITEELGSTVLDKENEAVIKRVIHSSADFEYAYMLKFSEHAVAKAKEAIKAGACIITDSPMIKAGIQKNLLEQYGGEVYCFNTDEEVAAAAKINGTTRAEAAMDKAAHLDKDMIFAIGNEPMALVRLYELIREGKVNPKLVIGVPVGFVNVMEAKSMIMESGVPYIISKGRKGGSTVAAAICNALLQ